MILFKQLVAADTKYTFTNQANCVTFDVSNDTPFNMGVSFGKDTGADNADYFTSPHSILTGIKPQGNAPSINGVRWTGTIYIYTETPLGTGATNLATAPAFQITVIGYPVRYQPSGSTSLSRMTSTPNMVNTSVSSTNSIINTGNPPATNIITVQPSDAASATWQADNSGNLTVNSDNTGVLTTLLQLIAGASPAVQIAAAATLTTVLGNLQVDKNLTVAGTSSLDNSSISTDGSGNITAVSYHAPTYKVGTIINLPIGTLKALTSASGTGNATVNTALGTTPTAVVFDPCTLSGSTQTIGGTRAQSTVISTGAGLGWSFIAYLQ